jgi:UDP-glucose 4-epimerase
MTDIARALIGDRDIEIKVIGIRPGEKVHESLISEEEATRTVVRGRYYAIMPMLPELRGDTGSDGSLHGEYSSANDVFTFEQTRRMLEQSGLMVDDVQIQAGELLA